MYATCLFCNNALGANETLAHFPVGRRLAYDAAKGRLWVVCRTCERWNLSPLETRFEAIDEAEQAFHDARLKVVSDNIGMAQFRDGSELVRIGRVQRPEFAAWRYGDQFGRRWRRYAVGSASVAARPAGWAVLQAGNFANAVLMHSSSMPLLIAMCTGMGITVLGGGFALLRHRREKRLVATVCDDEGYTLRLNQHWMDRSIVIPPTDDRAWQLALQYPAEYRSNAIRHRQGNPQRRPIGHSAYSTLTGDSALRVLATMLPHVNRGGGSKRVVSAAIDSVTQAKTLSDVLLHAPAPSRTKSAANVFPGSLCTLPAATRLALEMSLHEDDERRAMEGALAELEKRWRDADAIAKIADEMFLPEHIAGTLSDARARKQLSAEP